MEAYIISILNEFGYLGIGFLIAIENIFPPIPSEVILTFSGFMTTHTTMSAIGVIIAATVGALIGALLLYAVGYYFSEERMNRWIDGKLGKLLRLKKKDIHKAVLWFQNKGKYATLFGRCIPVVRSLISIPAGMAKMELKQFLVYTSIGTIAWNTVLVYLGAALGKKWKQVTAFFDTYTNAMLLIFGIALIGVIIYVLYKKKRSN